jgi:hypothetical protein
VQLVLAGKEELQGIDPVIFTGLQHGDQRQKLLDGRSCEGAVTESAQFRNEVHGVFGIVVIPRDTVVMREREQPVAVFLEPLLVLQRAIRPEMAPRDGATESLSDLDLFVQVKPP